MHLKWTKTSKGGEPLTIETIINPKLKMFIHYGNYAQNYNLYLSVYGIASTLIHSYTLKGNAKRGAKRYLKKLLKDLTVLDNT